MARYIDADHFISWLDVGHLRSPSEVCYSEGDVKLMIDMQPTVNMKEVIHCKNCHYYYKGILTRCTNPNGLKTPDDSTWCSYGERKQTND